MKQNPKVSVIIPVYNREHLIQRAIKSILNQTYENLEVIVVDDGSTDNTGSKVKEIHDPRLKYFKNQKNSGVSKSRNEGINLSSGEIIAFQDSDDESYPTRIEKQVKILLTSPQDVAAVSCGQEFIDYATGQKKGEEKLSNVDFGKNFKEGRFLLTPSTAVLMIKKAVFDEVGYFDENMRANVDTELAIRVSKKYKIAVIDELLVKVTRNHEQIMAGAKNQILGKEAIFQKHNDYLSEKILYGTCKVIANYYILTDNYTKAREYLVKSFKYKIEFKNMLLYLTITFIPFVTKYLYQKKYKGEIPLTSGLK